MNTDTIICGDNATVLAGFPDACIDLTVTSPPYDGLRKYNGCAWGFPQLVYHLYRVTKPGGVLVWVVADATIDGSETGTSFKQALSFMEIGFNLRDTMIFRKLNGAMGSEYTYLQEYEYMFVFSKGTPKTVHFLRDRKNVVHSDKSTPKTKSNENGSLSARHIVKRDEYGRRKNIWDYAVGGTQEIGYHPAPFPEALARDHILSWSNPGDLVLDPFVGSGTTPKMAKETGRHWIGIDISEEYCQLARRRVAGANVPLPFFSQVTA